MNLKTKGQEAKRQALLEISIKLLEQEGAAGLSMRRIAEAAQCSTTMLYTLFGGKEELANALYLEGFRRLEKTLSDVQQPTPLQQIMALNQTYRTFALEHPMFYSIMFERPIPEFIIPESSRLQAWQSMQPLQTAIQTVIKQKSLKNTDAEHLAMQIWMTTHGMVSLELAGYMTPEISNGAQMLEQLIQKCLEAHI